MSGLEIFLINASELNEESTIVVVFSGVITSGVGISSFVQPKINRENTKMLTFVIFLFV
jgi:hypothetical protein